MSTETSREGGAETPWTMTVPEAGRKYYRIKSTAAAYQFAAKGGMPTIRRNGKIFALPRVIERQLSGDAA